ncbi:hypothetical protein M2164_007995 [Streptomyces sp. SAI-208]|nr:hypothetical protein [Streptomyces sp. SAI-208]
MSWLFWEATVGSGGGARGEDRVSGQVRRCVALVRGRSGGPDRDGRARARDGGPVRRPGGAGTDEKQAGCRGLPAVEVAKGRRSAPARGSPPAVSSGTQTGCPARRGAVVSPATEVPRTPISPRRRPLRALPRSPAGHADRSPRPGGAPWSSCRGGAKGRRSAPAPRPYADSRSPAAARRRVVQPDGAPSSLLPRRCRGRRSPLARRPSRGLPRPSAAARRRVPQARRDAVVLLPQRCHAAAICPCPQAVRGGPRSPAAARRQVARAGGASCMRRRAGGVSAPHADRSLSCGSAQAVSGGAGTGRGGPAGCRGSPAGRGRCRG